ncbi:DNA-binding transcriptional LysR family regulator [Novosphingobium sp. SG751A]|uniref:LysR family transcriptional regulator n=1 Tax=Novosphingobium sp. SG751A TaxID=2587000 RepID=UPI00155461E1|nr:LysR family transcriptional regulator [Novosphingobium sp. SG751A]NOW47781.1 DNA-binding transcriptional LysR family regulator [Novosphingobium sp. SG751A]
MRFKGLDLNLLQALDVLLTDRSVSSAARKLAVTQPAMSAILARLREFFGDDLLTVHNRRMYPTAFAQSIWPRVREFLLVADSLVSDTSLFDPATSERAFIIGASDYLQHTLVFEWIRSIRASAPNVRFELSSIDEMLLRKFELAEADLMVLPEEYASERHPLQPLFEETHVVLGRCDDPRFAHPITEEVLLEAQHVSCMIGPWRRPSFADRNLEHLHKVRRIGVVVDTFMAVAPAVLATNCLAIVQRRLAERICELYPTIWVPLPFKFPRMREVLQFHHSRVDDEGITWLRQSLKEVADKTRIASAHAKLG